MKNGLLDTYLNTEKFIVPYINSNKINITYIKGAKVEILGNSQIEYFVEFIDSDTKQIIHSGYIKNNQWIKTSREWYTNWNIKIYVNGKCEFNTKINLENLRVYISFDSSSLGDTIAWIPYVEEFRKKHNCNIIVSTFWNKLFKDEYKSLQFVEPTSVIENIHAQYSLGIFDDGFSNLNLNKNDSRKQPLQKIAADLLGLEYKEIKSKVVIKNKLRKINGKYVCITEHATAQSKYWNNKTGWQEIVDYLNSIGYKVVVISKEKTKLKNIIDKTGPKDIIDVINILYYSKFFIGISSGLSWLAWAVNIPIIMISGHTKPWYEFKCNRVFNNNVCNGCWHDYIFDKGNWNWCPTNKSFECTKTITSNMVINEIHDVLNINTTKNKFMFYVNDKEHPVNLAMNSKGFNWNQFNNYTAYDSMFHEIFNDNCYSHGKCMVQKNDIVIDIGANIGVFERYAILNGAKTVYCYEPDSNNFKCLSKNISFNSHATQCIVSDKTGIGTLYKDKTTGGHSIINDNTNNTKTGKVITLSSKTLDIIFKEEKLEHVDFLKIDTEGAEIKIINGISNENLLKINKIALEYHDMIFNFDSKIKERFVDRFTKLGFNSWIQLVTTHLTLMYFWK